MFRLPGVVLLLGALGWVGAALVLGGGVWLGGGGGLVFVSKATWEYLMRVKRSKAKCVRLACHHQLFCREAVRVSGSRLSFAVDPAFFSRAIALRL